VKDVGLFLGWVQSQRTKTNHKQSIDE